MSKQVDERVVSMQFDNKHFESNVQTTMSTLDKLKQKLNLSGASKGLEDINAAAKKTDMSVLANGVETVRAKFSALQVMGVTALANITNSAVNAGKRIVKSLTIDPVTTGFNEYELKINSLQTIVASTGEKLSTVNKYLEELNEYSDKTIYSFSDMTQNIGKFTNAGVKLEDAVLAIKGISNEAAVSGANANEASRAMYNFAQALSAGYVKLIDWKSIENANMATKEFKEQLIESAVAAGTLTKTSDGMYKTLKGNTLTATKNFNETLSDQWMTTEALVTTLKKYADENTDIGKKAYAAAQDVKTFSMMLDTLKESAQSGWAKTWELLFGDLDEAKALWTGLTNFIGGFIDKMSDFRNNLLEGALGKGFSKLADKVKTVTKPLTKTSDALKTITKTANDYNNVVKEIIRGDWGNTEKRWNALTKAGYDWKHAQNLVNEELGYSKRYTTSYNEAQDKLNKSQKDSINTQKEMSKEDAARITQLANMSDAQLKNLGYTKEQIEALRELKEQSEKTGIPMNEFIEKIDEIDGRYLLINSFKNAGQGIVSVLKAIKDAWVEVFPPMTSDQLYNIIAGLHKFSTYLTVSDDAADKLKRTLKGLFAALDIVLTVVGGPIKIALKVLGELAKQLLGAFDIGILDLTASVGDAIVKFRDWIDSIFDVSGVVEKIVPYIKDAITAVKDWVDAVKPFEKIAEVFKKVADAIKNFAKSVWESDVAQNIISGLTDGLKNGAKNVWNAIVDIAKGMIAKIKSVLGIHSPSTEFKEVGENAIQGLINGLKGGIAAIVNTIKTLCSKMFDSFGSFDWSVVSNTFMNLAKLFPQLKIFNFISGLGGLFSIGGQNIISGLLNGLGGSASAVWEAITSLASNLISKFKEVLGIHSPSAVFFALGGFIIAGLLGGIMGGTTDITEALKSLGTWIIDFFKNLDIGTVIAAGSTIGILLIVKKILGIADKFASAAKGIGHFTDSLGKLVDTFNNGLVGKIVPSKWTIISNAILKVAIAIGILAAAVILMAKMDSGKLWGAIGALGVLIVAIAALGGVMVGLMAATKLLGDDKKISVMGNALLKIAATMGIMVIVAKIAAGMSEGDIKQGSFAILAFCGIIVGLMAATKLITGSTNVDKIGSTLLKISLAIGIMMLVAKKAASMTIAELIQGTAAIVAFGGIIVGLMAATKLLGGGKSVDKLGSSILKIAGAIGIMMIVAKIAASMTIAELIQGTAAIVAFGGIIVGLMAATKLIGGSAKNISKIGGTLIAIAGAIGIMMIVAKIVASMTLGELIQGTAAIVAFSGIIVGLMAATKLITGSKNIDKMAKLLLNIGITIGIMAASVALLSLIPVEKLAGATAALTILMGMFALIIYSTKNITKSLAPLIVMTAAIVILAGALFWVGQLPVESALGAAGALSGLMLTLTGVFLILSKFGNKAKDALKGTVALAALCVPLLLVAKALSMMSGVQNAITNAIVLASLVGVLTLLLIPLSAIGKNVKDALLGVVGLAAISASMFVLVGVLATMQNVKNAETNARALAGLATVLSLLLIPLSVVGILVYATQGIVLLGIAALAAMCIPLFILVGVLATMQNIQNATANTQLLIDLVNTLTKVLVVLAIVGPLAMIGVTAMGGLITLIGVVAVFATAIGALMEKFPQLQSFLDTGIPVMVQLAGGIGQMLGAFVGGIVEGVASSLPTLGQCLSDFMTNAMIFITGAKLVDEAVLKGVGILAAAIIALTAADFIAGIASFLQGGTSFSTLGTELSNFMMNAMPFIVGAKQIDPAIMAGVKTLAEAVLILTGADILEGLTSWMTGGSSLSQFGSQLGGLGTNLNTFVTNLGTFTDDQVKTVNCAGRAIKALASAASEIPNEGGWLGAIVGENSLASFGAELGTLGTNISNFVTNLGTFTEDQVSTVDCAGRAIKALASAASEIPNDGGWLGAIVGENSLATFGNKLPALGTNISTFVTNLGTFTEAQVTTVDCAGKAIKALASAANEIPNEGGFWSKIVGDNSLATFGDKLPGLADDIKNFVKNLGTFGEGQIATVNSACKAIKAITGLGKIDVGDTASGLGSLGKKLVGFGEKLSEFVSSISDVGGKSIESAVGKVKKVIDLAKTAASTNVESLKTFGSSLKKVATDGVKGFVAEFTSETPKNNIKNAATAMMKSFIKGLDDYKDDIKKKAKAVANEAVDGVEDVDLEDKGKTSGKDLGKGLVLGIEAKYDAAYKAGYKLGQKAVQGEKDGQESESPSKATIKAGKWLGEGLVIGIDKMGTAVYNSGKSMGKTAVNSISKAISNISDIVNSDIDSQPTITPVLDLSDVRSGTNAIGNMLSGRSISLDTSSVGVISASMAGFQNGNNSHEIVSSIKALRKDIANMPRESTVINGITYDDGSNISDAVQTLVRAARIERRT